MKSKKVICFILFSVLLISVCCGSFVSSATVYYVDGQPITTPGQTKTYVPIEEFNYAWADDIVVRDDSSSVTPLTITPSAEYPYTHTLEEFLEECNNYTSLFNVTDEVLESSLITTLRTMYYSLIAAGVITENNTTMRAYNEEQGIVYPYMSSDLTNIYTAIVYVSLKSDLYGALLDEQIDIPRGTTIEGAVVIILSKICGMELPASVDTISTFTYHFAEDFVIDENEYPVSENPTENEVYYWVRLSAADKAGYNVPRDVPFAAVTAEQEEYVLYAYYASILTNRYEVMLDPLLLRAALLSDEKETRVPELVLKAMLDDVSISYVKDESVSSLFEKAKNEGFFDLEAEFYTDIYNYNIAVKPDAEKVWFTTFLVADQLADGDIKYATTYVNGEEVANSTTKGVDLADGNLTQVVIEITYNDYVKNDKATYTFNVRRDYNAADVNGDLSINIADPVGSVLGSLSGSADRYFEGVEIPSAPSTYPSDSGNTLTTYPTDATTSSGLVEMYPTDANGNIIHNSNALDTTKAEEQAPVQVLDKTFAETVKENPEYVATPVGLLALGASAGYIFFRRRKSDFAPEAEIEVDDIDID